jgi:YidC/Oxa1 family membrane protein insertase
MQVAFILGFMLVIGEVHGFSPVRSLSLGVRLGRGLRVPQMVLHEAVLAAPMLHNAALHAGALSHGAQHWAELAVQGVAEAGAKAIACPGFGEEGWGPFCFLSGNPVSVFNAFDAFQESIQNSIVGLHDIIQNKLGIQNSYGISIVLFTVLIRSILFPITFRQMAATEKTKALAPKLAEINEKYGNDPNLKSQMTALLYQETQVNPLAGCLPALVQLPVFIALYRSFANLSGQNLMSEPFLWIPDLEGPVFGVRSMEWLTSGWVNGIPHLGWKTTALYLVMPVMLVIAQSLSLKILTPPSDDPQMQQSQRILKYLPLMIWYFSLSVPAALTIYWFTSNVLSMAVSVGIKKYFESNPNEGFDIDIDKLANNQLSAFTNPVWGYTSRQQMDDEARQNVRPPHAPRIPRDFM